MDINLNGNTLTNGYFDGIANDLTVTGDLTVDGDLTVTGSATVDGGFSFLGGNFASVDATAVALNGGYIVAGYIDSIGALTNYGYLDLYNYEVRLISSGGVHIGANSAGDFPYNGIDVATDGNVYVQCGGSYGPGASPYYIDAGGIWHCADFQDLDGNSFEGLYNGTGNIDCSTIAGDGSDLTFAAAPATSSSAGNVGQIAQDGTYLYACTASSTWVRASLTTLGFATW